MAGDKIILMCLVTVGNAAMRQAVLHPTQCSINGVANQVLFQIFDWRQFNQYKYS